MIKNKTAPSKATPSTLCQKCLKRGHYSYECTATAQQRPYAPRPSRMKQLQNPSLVPKLTSDTPNELLRKYEHTPIRRLCFESNAEYRKGVADEVLAKAADERGRKRQRREGNDRSTSLSSSSSASVSTISTNMSRSRSPTPPPTRKREVSRERTKRRVKPARSPSVSSDSLCISDDNLQLHKGQESVRRRPRQESSSRSRSVGRRHRRQHDRSRSPDVRRESRYGGGPDHSPRDRRDPQYGRDGGGSGSAGRQISRSDRRRASPSPFSKRIALTQAMNS